MTLEKTPLFPTIKSEIFRKKNPLLGNRKMSRFNLFFPQEVKWQMRVRKKRPPKRKKKNEHPNTPKKGPTK